MRKTIIIAVSLIALVISALLIYPHIEFKHGGVLYALRYSDDFSEFEENASYNEAYFYYEKQDISLKTFDAKNFLFFHLLTFTYEEGDVRETQFMLREEYIKHWLESAEITENPDNIDVAKLIEGREAVVSNTRYLGNEYESCIFFKLDGRYDEMYVFEDNGLIVIQVGSPDECPKYIAYK